MGTHYLTAHKKMQYKVLKCITEAISIRNYELEKVSIDFQYDGNKALITLRCYNPLWDIVYKKLYGKRFIIDLDN